MSSTTSELSHTVAFGRSKADLALLKAIKKHLSDHPDSSFNELCKDALRHFLMATEQPAALTLLLDLQQQLTELQIQIEAVEDKVAAHHSQLLAHSERSVMDLGQRLEKVEEHLYPERRKPAEPVVEKEPDPLIARMSKLIEEF